MAEQPPVISRRPGPSPEQVRRRRAIAIGAIVICVALAVAAVAVALPHVHKTKAAPPPPPPPPKPFRVVFPEGFTRAQMAARVGAVAKIAERKRHGKVALTSSTYLKGSRSAVLPCFTPRRRVNLEGFLFPATYDFLAKTPSKTLVADQLVAFCRSWRTVDLTYAKSKNLTPYDVLKIASMVEKETLAPAERPLVAAVIYNRLHARMPLGIDATLRYGLHIAPTQSILDSQLQSDNPYNSQALRPAADPDRESRPRLDPRRRTSGEGGLPLLRPQAGQGPPLLHGQ
jgi:hypothetical protein